MVISYFGSRVNARIVLAGALLFWSAATALTALATNFSEVAAARVAQGLGEAGCTPFATKLIADYFPKEVLGTAVSFYNVGIYTGYSLALSLGTILGGEECGGSNTCCAPASGGAQLVCPQISNATCCGDGLHCCPDTAPFCVAGTDGASMRCADALPGSLPAPHFSAATAEVPKGKWQTGYVVFGLAGVVVAILIIFTVRKKKRSPEEKDASTSLIDKESEASGAAGAEPAELRVTAAEIATYWLSSPTLILLCIAGGVRNAGGYVWAYQTEKWFVETQHVSKPVFSAYLGVIPLIGGSIGALVGGFVSDKLVQRKGSDGKSLGPVARIFVIIASCVLAAPFAAGALVLEVPTISDPDAMPWGFLTLIPSNVFGEAWIGVCMTLVIESVPSHLKAVSVAIYLFIISNIGGNMPLLVPVLEDAGFSKKEALLCLFPGLYVLAAVCFAGVTACVRRDIRRARRLDDERKRLLSGGPHVRLSFDAPEAASGDRTKSLNVDT